jgi:hypothetical protein
LWLIPLFLSCKKQQFLLKILVFLHHADTDHENWIKQNTVYTGVWAMDKSFNDQELSDIMKEIEALEEDYAGASDDSAPEVMEELSGQSESVSENVRMMVTEEKPISTSNIVSLKDKTSPSEEDVGKPSPASTAMSFKVQGNLTLDLQFEIGGKMVCLEVTESGLQIEIEGGITFAVPVNAQTQLKKAV